MFRWCMRARKVRRSVLHANMTLHEQPQRNRQGADSDVAPPTTHVLGIESFRGFLVFARGRPNLRLLARAHFDLKQRFKRWQ
jgi:hypothetical protein